MSSDNSNSKDVTSTLQAVYDNTVGVLQSTIGSMTGNQQSKADGEAKKTEAQAEHDASHAAARLGGYTVSASGGVARDHPDRGAGQWNQTVGAAKEAIGGLVGSVSLKQAGRTQNLDGQQQEAQGQLSDFAAGVGGRLEGAVGGAATKLVGDNEGAQHYQDMHDEGKARQRGAEQDMQKQVDAAAQKSKNNGN